MRAFNEVYDNVLGEIPCANTIDLWVRKCGLSTYEQNISDLSGEKHCLIIDESMMLGSNKLLLTLAAPAVPTGHPLRHSDVTLVSIDTAESFNAERISKSVMKTAKKAKRKPDYVITDNASVMKKGVRLTGFKHHFDLGHSLGMFLERTYKKAPDFQEYCKLMSNAQASHNMKRIAYLLPPRQRTIARFINLDNCVKWSRKMQEVYHTLSAEEQSVMSFIPANASLIDELSEVMSCVHYIENMCKQKGISKENAQKCTRHIKNTILHGNERMRNLALQIINYLHEETAWMAENETHNISSDIIESTYGVYKSRKSLNKLYGVTTLILGMPVFEKLSTRESARLYQIKNHIEKTRVKDIKIWKRKNLPENLVSKRIKTLSNQACF